jgi:hypothetical protein
MKIFSENYKIKRSPFERIVEAKQQTKRVVKEKPAQFFSQIFESREMAHIYHLQLRGNVGSFAQHEALGAYYEGVVEILDDLIEVYQGQYGIVEGYNIIDTEETGESEPLQYFTKVVDFLKESRYTLLNEDDPHYQAIIDEIINLLYRLIYKLRFLK